MSPPTRDLLITSPDRWDECCFAVPAVRAIAASGMGVGVLCLPGQASFWQSLAGIEVVTAATDGWQAALLWDAGRLAKAVRKARIEKRIGPALKGLGKHLTHPIQAQPSPLDHRVRFYLNVVREMGIECARPEFFEPCADGVVPGSILLAPDSDFGAHFEWPLERWIELGEALAMGGKPLAVAVTETGRRLGQSLAQALGERAQPTPVDLTTAPLEELGRHQRVVAADGSLPHLAAHAGATCFTLFGPNDPQWKRPLGKRHTVVRHHVECAPCLLPKCPMDLRCQDRLTVERVLQSLG